jgi:hypothetical protein
MIQAGQGKAAACQYHRSLRVQAQERFEALARKDWGDLSARQRRGVVLGGVVQIGLLAAALADIYQRPQEDIRGNKWLWTAAAFVNFVGPISYFLFGRKR